MLKRRAFLGLLLLSWAPFVVRAVQIYIASQFPQASALAPTAQTFRAFLDGQSFFVFVVTVYVGAGLIANDRRANALQLYLSRPLTRVEYVAGKMAILVTFLLFVTWVPAICLLITQVVFAGSFAFARAHVGLIPAITVCSLIQVLVASFTMLALSSLSNSSRYVAVLYAGAVLFSDANFTALRAITGSTMMSWISFPANVAQLGDLVFRVNLRYQTPPAVSLVVVVALVVVSISILERRIRGVEVVA